MNLTFPFNLFGRLQRNACVGTLALTGLLVVAGNQALFGADEKAAGSKVSIRGSNTIGEELAPKLIGEYKKTHADVTFDLEFKGSAYGIGNVLGGFCDIAGSSKALLPEQEEIAKMRGVQLKEYILGAYSIAILVNATNPVSNLTSNQVAALFTGAIKNWKEVGGPDAAVQLYVRDPVSGTHLGFKEIAMGNQSYASGEKLFASYGEIAAAVAKDPHGLGYVGLDLVQVADTKALSVNGVAPCAENVNAKKYPYARALRFYTDTAKESPAAKDFIDFTLSPSGQGILKQLGYAPKP